MSAEPCPNCGARVVMIRIGEFKKCPVCGHIWYDAGPGRSARHPYTGSGGAGAMEVVPCRIRRRNCTARGIYAAQKDLAQDN